MTTDMSGGPGVFRRLMNKVATWSEASTAYTVQIFDAKCPQSAEAVRKRNYLRRSGSGPEAWWDFLPRRSSFRRLRPLRP